ncbi:MAG: AAA family ATPase, partial [Caldilineaceae bacterium]|nr:AAA family ATPase [Caldilineaceae bacterium]
VYTRLQHGLGNFLAELQPTVAFFLRFAGIDYDADAAAGQKLDSYIRWVQTIVDRYEGTLIDLNIGDKGSYLYINFGAPVAHENNADRAAATALALMAQPEHLRYIAPVQIGISQGRMRAGAYGSRDRRTYGVQGPAVNLAARLMMQAKPGQVLTDPHSATLLEDIFVLSPAGHVVPKGQSQSVPVLAVGRRLRHSPIQHEHGTNAPVVGRDDELAVLTAALARTCSGQGQVVRMEAETGMGRSSLVAAFVQSAKRAGAIVAAAGCESTEGDTAYFAARQIAGWLLGLGLLRNATPAQKVDHIRHFVQSTEPDWLPRLPLLGDLLGLPIPDNDLTAGLDARLRREALYSLTVAIVQTITKQTPLVLVVEDIHWIDEASLGLLMALGRSVTATPLLLLLTHRSQAQEQDLRRLNTLEQVQQLTPQTTVTLRPMAQAAIRRLIENRLGGPTTSLLLELIQSQAQGNPFFAEELVDALRERAQLALEANGHWHLQPATLAALRQDGLIQERDGVLRLTPGSTFNDSVLGLPASLHGAVLERLDALPEPLKLTLKTASVIGRRFSLQLLAGVHPTHVTMDALEAELAVLTEHHFTRVDVEGTSGSFLFRH